MTARDIAAEARAFTPPGDGGRVEGERRQVTALFCDLVGSTELSARLDPEDMHELLSAYHQACAAVVARFDGYTAHYLGDGILAFFGYPRVHEDDPHRAVHAGLGILEAIDELSMQLGRRLDARLAARVGIHTGLVVVGEMGLDNLRNLDIVGQTPNMAARLQALAEPNTVIVSEVTRRLIGGFFDSSELGSRSIKGLERPVPVYRVHHQSAARNRLEAVGPIGLTPLVGRGVEVNALLEAWRRVRAGAGGVVLLRGEPGIGKSRLVRELARHVATEPDAWMTPCQCSPYRQHTSMYPIGDVLERVAIGFHPSDGAETKLRKIEGWAASHGLEPSPAVPLIASLLSVPLDDRYTPLGLMPERQKQLLIETIVGTLCTIARRQPLLFIVEDLHWTDPSTEEFLGSLIERAGGHRILVLLTARLDYNVPWSGLALGEIKLERLEAELVTELAREVAGGREFPSEVRDQIITKADGVPLFVEELTKTVLESGLLVETDSRFVLVGPLSALAVPVSLEGSLLARLDQLPAAREVAQIAAVLGRDFSEELMLALVTELGTHDDETLERSLRQLVDAGILHEQYSASGTGYMFTHALIRDAAYESLLKSGRRAYHEQILRILTTQFPETSDTQPELLAHHASEAGLYDRAIVLWRSAAQRAIERSGNAEAIAYLNTALALLDKIPDHARRTEHELEARVALGVPLIAMRGYAAPDVAHTYARAHALSREVGETSQLPNILWGLWVYYVTGGSLRDALETAAQYGALSEAHPDDDGLAVETCQLHGVAHFYYGEFEKALSHLERGREIYNPATHHAHVFAHGGVDTGVTVMMHEALALWASGRPDTARRRMRDALALARRLSHPFSLAMAYCYAAWFHTLCRDDASALAAANTASRISEEFGFPFWAYTAGVLLGSTLARQGQLEAGIAQATQNLAAFDATGGLLGRSALEGLLADAYLAAGCPDEGLLVVGEALKGLSGREERWWEPELHRVRGELLRQQGSGPGGEVERCFERALSIARGQRAGAWELRSAVSLARLWRDRGDVRPARALLVEIDERLTEGRATDDRRAARTLLGELEP